MNLGDLKQRCKLKLPNIGQTGVGDAYLVELLNQACDRCNEVGKFYYEESYFNVVADQSKYPLSENVTDYLGMGKVPLYFKLSSGDWKQVYPKTEAYIQRTFPDYLNADSVTQPQYYYLDGDNIVLYPPADTARDNALMLKHLKASTPMSNDNHYPFTGTTTEITAFKPMEEAIVAFVKWQIEPSYGKVSDTDLGEQRFNSEVRKAKRKIKRRPDAIGSPYNGMRF